MVAVAAASVTAGPAVEALIPCRVVDLTVVGLDACWLSAARRIALAVLICFHLIRALFEESLKNL